MNHRGSESTQIVLFSFDSIRIPHNSLFVFLHSTSPNCSLRLRNCSSKRRRPTSSSKCWTASTKTPSRSPRAGPFSTTCSVPLSLLSQRRTQAHKPHSSFPFHHHQKVPDCSLHARKQLRLRGILQNREDQYAFPTLLNTAITFMDTGAVKNTNALRTCIALMDNSFRRFADVQLSEKWTEPNTSYKDIGGTDP